MECAHVCFHGSLNGKKWSSCTQSLSGSLSIMRWISAVSFRNAMSFSTTRIRR